MADDYFGQIVLKNKIPNTVLPVFFRQADACLVTRSSFETMTELNPQLGQQLRILLVSEPYVPVVFCFRDNYQSEVKAQVLKEIENLHLSPAGRQILTIFQIDKLFEQSSSVLDITIALLQEHQMLLSGEQEQGAEMGGAGKP